MKVPGQVVDADWALRMASLKFGTTGILNQKQSNLVSQKTAFLEGKAEFPVFSHQHVRRHKFEELKEKYEAFLVDVKADTTHHEVVRALYEERILEKLVEIELVLLASSDSAEVNDTEFQNAFKRCNAVLYGEPTVEVFNDVLFEVSERLRQILRKRPERKVMIDAFIEKYCRNAKDGHFPRAHFDTSKFNKDLAPLKDAAAIQQAFEQALLVEGLAEDWKAVVDTFDKRRTISVGYSTRRIYIPGDAHYARLGKRNALGAKALQKMIVHEVHAHVRRQDSGSKSSLQLLGLGLRGSRMAEEGVATYSEQELLADNQFFAGYLSYFTIGTAHGLDRGSAPRSFRELFNVLSELFMLVYDNNKAVADRLAWDRCIRVYRGSRAHLPGTVLHKDLLYRTGNIHIHGLVAANPAITNWFFAGRFDPGNTKHVEALLALGIITPL